MKTLLVTSSLTYCPGNYDLVLEKVISESRENIAGAVMIEISRFGVARQLPGLYLMGCRRLAGTLCANLFRASAGKKEAIFKKNGIPFFHVKNINDGDFYDWARSVDPDLIVNLRGRCIFVAAVLDLPRLGCVNVHHGLLPEQRGLYCDLNALVAGRKTGFTIHKMVRSVDQGEIFFGQEIKGENDYMEYLTEVSKKEGAAIADFMNKVAESGTLPPGRPNSCRRPIITSTPDAGQIRSMLGHGILL